MAPLQVHSPQALRALDPGALPAVCAALRVAIVQACAPQGGHLGGSLGAVELTVALHRAFDTPHDLLVFDTGHQAYAHKLLTGRSLDQLRQEGGAAGFLERAESAFDAWGAGHASTGISGGLGLAEAAHQRGERRRVAVVVGDGALTGGLSYEGLSNAGELRRDLVVVLNDNGMSIAPNVGALSHTQKFRQLFDALGFDVRGPVDGHDLAALETALADARDAGGPVMVHVRTEKGRGFALAEADAQTRGHAMGPFDAALRPVVKAGRASYTEVFSAALRAQMERDARVVALTAAMPDGTGLLALQRDFPGRVYDVGIAEQHAVTFAAALAAGGLKPVVAIYSTFMQRALDGVLHDAALQRLPVVFAMDRAGLVGGDGATHQGAFDLSFLRATPGLVLMAPSDEAELGDLLATALSLPGPSALRYPRGAGPGALPRPAVVLPIGQARVVAEPAQAVASLWALGPAVQAATQAAAVLAAEGRPVSVVDARFVKPLDEARLLAMAREGPVVTIEHAARIGGFGSAVLECLADHGVLARVVRLGLPDRFIPHGDAARQYAALGMDAGAIIEAVRKLVPQPGM
jgi:1-deoxy-D-xylulose-5-phosphate synthase